MTNWESHTTTEAIAHRAADRYGFTPAEEQAQLAEWSQLGISFGPPPDRCDIAHGPLWAPLPPIEGCDCQACQRRRYEAAGLRNEHPGDAYDFFAGLRNGILITLGILAIVWLAFKLGGWQ